mgnify:CR=1 FL=1
MASNGFSTGYGQNNPMFKRVQQSINATAGSKKTPILISKPSQDVDQGYSNENSIDELSTSYNHLFTPAPA